MDERWYLMQTKAGQERRAQVQVALIAEDVLLPLIRTAVRRWGAVTESVAPLFPCYLFARFDFESEWRSVRYARGVRTVVCFGTEPAVVPDWIIVDFKERCAQGPLELLRRPLSEGERVRVIGGPFQEFEGIFERHLSGAERVAVLLSVMGVGARTVLPASAVVPAV